MTHPTLTERLTRAARELQHASDPNATMEAAVQIAVANIHGCDHAGLSLTRAGGIETPASTDDVVLAADTLQNALGEGPCLRAAWDEQVVHAADLADDPRWPAWGPRVASELGLRSALCFQLFTEDGSIGALNLYSTRRDAFDEDDVEEGCALAAHIAIAVSSAETREHLTRALDARTMTGQAVGIVMERYQVDAATAFRVLVRTSSHANVKLRIIAQELVETGNLRGTPPPAGTEAVEDVP